MNYLTAIVASTLMLAGASALADETRMGKMPKPASKAEPAVGTTIAPGKEATPSKPPGKTATSRMRPTSRVKSFMAIPLRIAHDVRCASTGPDGTAGVRL